MADEKDTLKRNMSAGSRPSLADYSQGELSLTAKSLRAIALQATSTEPDTVRSISGRLGGHFDSSRTVSHSSVPGSVELPNEATRLMPPSPGLTISSSAGDLEKEGYPPQSLPLQQWIVPALSCAAAYAFYNVSY